MRRITLTLAVLALLVSCASAQATRKASYYLSLGDSLSVGLQPSDSGFSLTKGYTGRIIDTLRSRDHSLHQTQFGCAGATTASFMRGGQPCLLAKHLPYANRNAKTSQLATAEQFLRKHKGRVNLVTIDLGANDVFKCVNVAQGSVDFGCLGPVFGQISANMDVIAHQLRQAAGSKVVMVGMTYYDPILSLWLKGDDNNRNLAAASVSVERDQLNAQLKSIYRHYRFRVADVAEAFGTYVPFSQTTQFGSFGQVPAAVANACQYTWACDAQHADIHARDSGYDLIARTFEGMLTLFPIR